MICPVCRGRGVVRKRFLCIRWRRRCSTCGGAGQLDDDGSITRRPVVAIRDDRGEDWIEDDRRRDYVRDDRFVSSWRGDQRQEPFVVGEGGRSGGAGGGAAWDERAGSGDAASRDDRSQPLIVDPFVGDLGSMAASDAVSAEASSPESTDAAVSESSSSADGGSNTDSGTAY
jgi:hypothetical protein